MSVNKGLTAKEIEESRAKFGENVLTPPAKPSMWLLYIEKYKDPIIKILIFAACISLVLAFYEGNYIETIGIFIAIFLATTIGFYFERDAAKKFDVLTALGEEQLVKVRRDGRVQQIKRREVVVGDIVLIEPGDEIPADGELIKSIDLQIDESQLTGEPIANKREAPDGGTAGSSEDAAGEEEPKEESTYPANLVLRSSMVMNGRGMYRVTKVGDMTEIGKVQRKSTEETEVETPLNKQLNKLAKVINKFGFGLSIAAFVVFLVHDILTNPLWHSGNYMGMAEEVLKYFMMTVTLIVMAVPEGLPMAVTLSLALNMRRMLKSNNLVRKLHASETMGAVTVICTDKTGTLTQNKMQVSEMVIFDHNLFHNSLAMNTTAHLNAESGIGNPTEIALLLWLRDQGVDYSALRHQGRIISQQPFSTERKYMSTTVEINGSQHTFVKGAPEIVLNMCQEVPDRSSIEEKLLDWQRHAQRTLAFAIDGRFVAFTAISDPIREDVPEAIKQCHKAGIRVKMVTGDTEATAREIAKRAGLHMQQSRYTHHSSKPHHIYISGEEWAKLSDGQAMFIAKDIAIMYRARPTDKQRLVEMLQKQGEVVAVTGDGTNDAPALHYAHVGLSLGSSTSVAKEASDMTLLDDSFKSIVSAVKWGRSLYKNIQRFLYFQLVVNVAALLLVLGGAIIGTEMPLTVTQILWVNLIMDTFAAMALASLPAQDEVMNEKPRKQTDFILSPDIIKNILLTGFTFFLICFGFFFYIMYFDDDPGVKGSDLTMFFNVFVMLQFWNLFNAKQLGSRESAFKGLTQDKGFLFILAMILLGQVLIVEFGGEMFRTVHLSPLVWLATFAGTSVVAIVGEIRRRLKPRRRHRHHHRHA